MSGPRSTAGVIDPPVQGGRSGVDATLYEALFASDLQFSCPPGGAEVLAAITRTIRALGPKGCLERVAQEFGDHPDSAVIRMRQAKAAVSAAAIAFPV
jgi:hypothetical protein